MQPFDCVQFNYAPNAEARNILRAETGLWNAQSILYVGAHPQSRAFADEFATFSDVTLLEAWRANCEYYAARGKPFRHVQHGDALAAPFLFSEHFDAVVWWQGPEHVMREFMASTLNALQKVAPLLVVGCPWGIYPQGAEYGNPHEAHLSYLYPSDFEELGFTVRAIGKCDDPNGCLIGYRRGLT